MQPRESGSAAQTQPLRGKKGALDFADRREATLSGGGVEFVIPGAIMKKLLIALALLPAAAPAQNTGPYRGPIIDVHLHAQTRAVSVFLLVCAAVAAAGLAPGPQAPPAFA